jgi:hypothetical protein
LASGLEHVTSVRARRCAACAKRRSTTNLLAGFLLLAAFLSYLWYDKLTNSTAASWEGRVVASLAALSLERPATPPAPPPVASPTAPEIPPAVRPAPRKAPAHVRTRRRSVAHRPPSELDGLY